MNAKQSHDESERELIRLRTAPEINARIDRGIEKNIRYYAARPKEELGRRLRELDAEWDIERALQANAATIGLLGLSFGILKSRRWLALPVGVLGFLLMHSIQGWCPPVPVMRRAGIRTRSEIDREKFALQYLRGDFEGIGESESDVNDAVAVAVENRT
ncbi:DUF2892 domain-containing protein [Opitutales bacterium ASA1]|uniref:YgaP family membrane protein n=1 Tax=Congregicoccus parvus TaxID=3081749 RepID=UPI002B2BED44|nr:DUF2892 domain-containing protein [Opitutales bacterium ASA1]